MTEDAGARFQRILAEQLAMNEGTWRALQQHGVTEKSQLRLDFAYQAPGQKQANALRDAIAQSTDYEVAVVSEGSFLAKSWSVLGKTQQMTVSLEVLNHWVERMVSAGRPSGCVFDGWGAEV
jgi:hypothetical protein